MVEYLNDFNTISTQLQSTEFLLVEEIRSLFLMSNVPDSWKCLMVAMGNSLGNVKPNLSYVTSSYTGEKYNTKTTGKSEASIQFVERIW